MVSSTGSSQTYTYHKLLAKEADVEQLSNDINDFAARYRVTNGEPNSDNDEGDLIYDKDADKMKVFDSTTNAFKEVTSVGDYKFLFLCPAGGTGSPTINGNIATYDLREGSTSGSAATVTNAAQLIVSINGVIQKPNTGTSAPSEGFAMVDSNTIIFGSNLPTGASIFIVQIGSATTLNVPADNSVSTAKLQSGSINNAKVATDAAIDSTKLSFTGTGTGATARTISTKLLEQVSVKDYGATGDGSTDDTTAIQNALIAANAFTPKKGVFVPAGKYKLTNRLLVPHGVSLIGEGMGVTIFDTTTATYSSFTSYSGSGKAVIHTPAPTYTQIADPSADIARNAKSFAIASISSPSAIAEGDFLLIWNDTDGSFSAHRTYYKAGEILKISDINSTTLFFESSVVDDYTASAVNLYKVTYGQQDFKGFTILCNPAGGSQAFGLIAQGLKHSVVRDVEVLNAPYTGISVQECYDITVDRCHATDNHLENSGEYGLSIGNSQVVSVSNGKFTAARHGLATGGSSGIGSITCRFMSFTNNNVTTSDANGAGNTQAFNIHGNSEYVTVSNNTFDGGANIAGDHTVWTGNNMYGKSLNGSAVLATEMVGFSHTFKGNIIRSTMTDGERGVFIDFGGNSEVFEGSGKTKHGGNLVIDGNTLIWDNIDNTRTYTGIIVKNTSFAEAEKIKLIVTNNTTIGQKVKTDNDGTQFGSFIMVEWGAGSAWEEINISNNVVHGGYHIREVGSDPEVAAKNVYVHNNHFKRGYYCIANNVTDLYSCKGNTFEQFEQYIGSFGENSDSDNTDYHTKVVHFTDNTLIDVMWGYNSSSSTRASVTLWRCQKVYCSNNIIMGNPVKLRMDQDIGGLAASHEKGDIITGGSSGKVATVLGEQGTFLHIGTTARTASAMFPHPSSDSYIGNWTDGETITATGRTDVTLDGAAPVNTRTYAFSFLRVGKLYEYLNIDEQGLNNYYGTNVTQKARLYDDSGALKYKGSGGTTTTLGAA